MISVLDVAAYILNKKGMMTAMKLQKLVYYAQAWSLVWDEKPLFSSKINACASGPVVPVLYGVHKGQYLVSRISGGNSRRLNQMQRETVDAVLKFYGDKTSQWLSVLAHSESPWIEARERGNNEITPSSMVEYYSSL